MTLHNVISLASRILHLAFLEGILIFYYVWVIQKLARPKREGIIKNKVARSVSRPLGVLISLNALSLRLRLLHKNMTPRSFPDSSQMNYTRLIQGLQATPNIVFNATYYLDLSNAITNYCVSHFFLTKVRLVVLTL
jgi:hypothetical protein